MQILLLYVNELCVMHAAQRMATQFFLASIHS